MIKTNMSPEEIQKEIDALSPWYSIIELSPGIFTSGHGLRNIGITRELVRRTDLKNCLCLDIGAMEAVISILLKRQGAKDVVAIDGDNRAKKIPLLQAVYGEFFQYYGSIALHNTLDFLLNKSRLWAVGKRQYQFGFDVVILSGVLYHVYSPIHVLAMARSCLRPGGLLIIETAAVKEPGYKMHYNYNGKGYTFGWTDTWFITVPLLDYFCRFFKLQPLDCLYTGPLKGIQPDVVRFGTVCRAVDSILNLPGDDVMVQSSGNYDYNSIVRYDLVTPTDNAPVNFEVDPDGLVMREDINTCDLYGTMCERAPMPSKEEHAVLKLDDMY